ncbi:MAG: DsbA family protein [Pseudomonadales bacterium]
MTATGSDEAPLVIDYYTDVLCVWAWIAQRRIEALAADWRQQIHIRHHCVNVFGDTRGKMASQWAERGGFDGYADHVHSVVANYETAPVHRDAWRTVRPTTSANAHLVLKAAAIVHSEAAMVDLAGRIRHAFFVEAEDVSDLPRLFAIASDAGLPQAAMEQALNSGEAAAALLADYDATEQQGVKGSPSWVMNGGRQILYGNVGYRILNANVEELLRHPEQEASWC